MITNSSNFREINVGEIAPKVLYRSSHPIWNGKQVNDTILSIKNAKIKTVINLSDSTQSLQGKVLCCPWYKTMLEDSNVIALNINMKFDIMESEFIKKIGQGIRFMIEHDPPYLVHCEAGVDRTGFLSILLESFMKANFDAIVKDYMLSFAYSSEHSKDYRTGEIYVFNLFSQIKGGLINPGDDPQCLSSKYLMEKVGLNNDELMCLKNKLMRERINRSPC